MAGTKRSPEARRSEIVAAARNLFATKGVACTTVSEVVRRAGIAQGTFYLYFKSKTDALNAVAGQIADEACAAIEAASRSEELDALQKVRRIRQILMETRSDDEGSDLMEYFHTKGDKRFHDELERSVARRLTPAVAQAIEQGVSERAFRVADPQATAEIVIAAASAIHGEGAFGNAKEYRRKMDAYWEFVLRGLGYREPEGDGEEAH